MKFKVLFISVVFIIFCANTVFAQVVPPTHLPPQPCDIIKSTIKSKSSLREGVEPVQMSKELYYETKIKWYETYMSSTSQVPQIRTPIHPAKVGCYFELESCEIKGVVVTHNASLDDSGNLQAMAVCEAVKTTFAMDMKVRLWFTHMHEHTAPYSPVIHVYAARIVGDRKGEKLDVIKPTGISPYIKSIIP